MKAQAAFEYLMVVGFAILFITPIIIFFYTQRASIYDDILFAQVKSIGNELNNAITSIYYLGPPSKQTINLYVPHGVKNMILNSNSITFTMDSSAFGLSNYTIYPHVNLTGSIYYHTGDNIFVIEAENFYVNITN